MRGWGPRARAVPGKMGRGQRRETCAGPAEFDDERPAGGPRVQSRTDASARAGPGGCSAGAGAAGRFAFVLPLEEVVGLGRITRGFFPEQTVDIL